MPEDDLQARVLRVLREEVAPALELDADQMELCAVEDGVVRLRLGRLCGGCPSTIMAVMMGLEQELRRRIPEVEYLELIP
jgi:Fe-S cluster biogenesis protein NfuA